MSPSNHPPDPSPALWPRPLPRPLPSASAPPRPPSARPPSALWPSARWSAFAEGDRVRRLSLSNHNMEAGDTGTVVGYKAVRTGDGASEEIWPVVRPDHREEAYHHDPKNLVRLPAPAPAPAPTPDEPEPDEPAGTTPTDTTPTEPEPAPTPATDTPTTDCTIFAEGADGSVVRVTLSSSGAGVDVTVRCTHSADGLSLRTDTLEGPRR